MKRKKPMTPENKKKLLELRKAGVPPRDIAAQIGCSIDSVYAASRCSRAVRVAKAKKGLLITPLPLAESKQVFRAVVFMGDVNDVLKAVRRVR